MSERGTWVQEDSSHSARSYENFLSCCTGTSAHVCWNYQAMQNFTSSALTRFRRGRQWQSPARWLHIFGGIYCRRYPLWIWFDSRTSSRSVRTYRLTSMSSQREQVPIASDSDFDDRKIHVRLTYWKDGRIFQQKDRSRIRVVEL